MRKLIIDRFEGDFAVCETENLEFINLPKAALPSEAKEGDGISISIDNSETDKRKEKIEGLMNSLFKD
ncbi:MAG: DUF3006 domain-containing protein [Eubacterium sp.]|nr:DUF3006 domain-containing protein [Eubacterium sp.]